MRYFPSGQPFMLVGGARLGKEEPAGSGCWQANPGVEVVNHFLVSGWTIGVHGRRLL